MINSGNPTLDKNLECINRYNPSLAAQILNLPYLSQKIELIQTEKDEPNLSLNEKPLHSQKGAEEEAKKAFQEVANTNLSMHILFGLGLGHIFKEFCENSNGVIFLIEPNIEILRVTFELVDFSAELSKNNVFVSSDLQSFKQFYITNYKYNCKTSFTYLGSYKDIFGEKLNETVKQIEMIAGGCQAEYNTLKKEIVRSISMTLDNLPYTLNETPLLEYENIYKDKTALIVSAGPSLDSNIETIKKNREKVVIFCVGTAFKALAVNGITPDFVNIIEINDCSGQLKDFDLSNINLILEPYTNTSIHKLETKTKLLFPTKSTHANDYWAKVVKLDISKYQSKGTVSHEAIMSAKLLGFKKIILVGQDLAYINNKCYSDNAAYSQLSYEINPQTNKPEFKIKDYDKYVQSLLPVGQEEPQEWCKGFSEYKVQNLTETLYYVKGITGDMLPTQGGYATFIEHFKDFANSNKHLSLINTSMVGAQIDGFKNMPLDEALKDETVVEKIELEKKYTYDINSISKNLKKEIEALNKIQTEFSKAKEHLFKFERELQRRKTVSQEAEKQFKSTLLIYDKITKEYYNKNPLYQALAFNENIEVNNVLLQNPTFNTESIKLINPFLKNYFEQVYAKIEDFTSKIQKTEAKINESTNPES